MSLTFHVNVIRAKRVDEVVDGGMGFPQIASLIGQLEMSAENLKRNIQLRIRRSLQNEIRLPIFASTHSDLQHSPFR